MDLRHGKKAGEPDVAETIDRGKAAKDGRHPRRIPARARGLLASGVIGLVVVVSLVVGPSLLPRSGPPAGELMTKMSRALRSPHAASASFTGRVTIGGSTSISQNSFSASATVSGRFDGSRVQVTVSSPTGTTKAMLLDKGFYLQSGASAKWDLFPLGAATKILTAGQSGESTPTPAIVMLLSELTSTQGQSFEGPTIDGTPTYEVRPLLRSGPHSSSTSPLTDAEVSIFIGRSDSLPRRLDLSMTLDPGNVGSAGTTLGAFVKSVDIDLDLEISGWGSRFTLRPPKDAVDQAKQMQQAIVQDDAADEIPGLLGISIAK